jgi:hypothetical protein
MITNGYTTQLEAKAWINMADASLDDLLVDDLVNAASRAVDGFCGQWFYTAGSSASEFRTFDRYVCNTDPVSNPATAVVKVDYGQDGTYETTLTLATDYFWEPLSGLQEGISGTPASSIHLVAGRYFPQAWYNRPQVQVTATWGWAAVPPAVKQATLQVVGELWKRKDAPFGILGGQEFGTIYLSPDAMRSVSALLRPYRTGTAVAAMA